MNGAWKTGGGGGCSLGFPIHSLHSFLCQSEEEKGGSKRSVKEGHLDTDGEFGFSLSSCPSHPLPSSISHVVHMHIPEYDIHSLWLSPLLGHGVLLSLLGHVAVYCLRVYELVAPLLSVSFMTRITLIISRFGHEKSGEDKKERESRETTFSCR